jgi:hypothetical protein
VGEYVQEPVLPDSFFPTRARPEMRGAFVTAGTSTTTLVKLETAAAVPAAFVPNTRAASVWPASACVTTYAADVAAEIAAHPVPLAPQRNHA